MGGIQGLFYHDFLVKGAALQNCYEQVYRFLTGYTLVSYERIQLLKARSVFCKHPEFYERLHAVVQENEIFLKTLIQELADEGFHSMDDIRGLPTGYVSKLFHVTAHMVDGFFGIDSRFYNLIEGSHGVSQSLRMKLGSPDAEDGYWLVAVECAYSDALVWQEHRA
ncbi:MAG: hypothetical protein ABWK15_02115 [Dissulfuribacterales bacterium]